MQGIIFKMLETLEKKKREKVRYFQISNFRSVITVHGPKGHRVKAPSSVDV